MRDLPQAAAAATEHAREVIAPRRFPSELRRDPPSPAPAANAVDPAFSAASEAYTAPTPSSAELEGLDNAALTGGIVNPPDPQLAVGPDHIIEMVNIVGLIRADAWPPDINSNGHVQIDDVTFVAGKFALSSGEPGYSPRAELASQAGIILIDDVTAAASSFGAAC